MCYYCSVIIDIIVIIIVVIIFVDTIVVMIIVVIIAVAIIVVVVAVPNFPHYPHYPPFFHFLVRFFCSYRHGQSEYNAIGRIGGDSGLSAHGVNYAKKLAEFVEDHVSGLC